jgi:hypothetical protein
MVLKGEFWKTKERRSSDRGMRVFIFERRIGELEVLEVESHKLCFNITHVLSVVLRLLKTKREIIL